MGSYNAGKKEIVSWAKKIFPKGATCLDVGPSDGKWADLLGDHFTMDAVEIFEPYIQQNHLWEKYRAIINKDIFDVEYEYYDLILFGDIIEHMDVTKAQTVLNYAKSRCHEMVIAVPFLYPQDACNGNPYEKHIQDDLTETVFEERYPGFHMLYKYKDLYAYYTKGEYDMSNKKVLDIVITHYNEPWTLVEPCLMILKLQKCVDFNKFRVTVVHDGAEKFDELKDVEFPFEFREICIPHGGVSAARNKGIDLADAEWITFIDCDDCYSDVYSLGFIMPSLENDDQFNLLWSKFYITRDVNVEAMPDSTKEIDWIWMANKYYRTDFLKERGIRFLEGLDYAEDSAFNNWVRFELKDEECGEILTPAPLYAWCRRKGSATTSSGNLLRNAMHILKRNIYVSDMYKHYKRDATGLMMARTITDGYSAAMSIILNNNHKAKEEYIKQLKEFYNENRDLIDKVTPDEWQYVLEASTENRYSGYKYISEMQPFEEWFKKVIKE